VAKKQDLKSMVSGVLEGALREAPLQAPEVERRLAEMAPAPVASRVLKLPLDRIYPDPDQPRRTFRRESLEELAASIREQGVLEPIQVIATDQGYQLLHGERRWRAAHLAGLTWIPSIIYEQPLSDADRLIRQLIENIQREDLNDVDRATALERLKDLLNVSWEEVAEKVGLTVGRIHQLRRLSRLAPELQAAVKAGQISEKDTRPYQGLTEEQQVALYRAGQAESLPPDMVKQVADRLKRRPELVEGRRPDPSVGLGTGLVEGRRPEPPPTDRDRDREDAPGRPLSVEEEEISQAIRQVSTQPPSPALPRPSHGGLGRVGRAGEGRGEGAGYPRVVR
jgi:ParB/RepB/Spo0J family partition protein